MPEQTPKISGYTFLRNGVKLGYPFKESLRSLSPLCHEIVIALGPCDDGTGERILALNDPKIRIIRTEWNERMRDRGFVYAQQKMIAHYNCTGDWAFYLEGDEVLHERDIERIRTAVTRHHDDARVEAFAFRYHHFYGDPGTVATSPGWYRSEVRLVRNTLRWFAPDGLFSVVMNRNRKGRYPRAVLLDAKIYHYGHVRNADRMADKVRAIGKYWAKNLREHRYSDIDFKALGPFEGTHPAIMNPWLETEAEQNFVPDTGRRPTPKEQKHRLMMKLERLFGRDLSKRHYKPIRIP